MGNCGTREESAVISNAHQGKRLLLLLLLLSLNFIYFNYYYTVGALYHTLYLLDLQHFLHPHSNRFNFQLNSFSSLSQLFLDLMGLLGPQFFVFLTHTLTIYAFCKSERSYFLSYEHL